MVCTFLGRLLVLALLGLALLLRLDERQELLGVGDLFRLN